jgi:parallel beta-helix repeat protein
VYVESNGTFTMQGGSVQGNTATGYGGGVLVFANSGTFTLSGGSIEGNTATGYGGGVYLYNSSALTKTGGTIYGNNASDTQRNKVTGYTDHGAAVWVADTDTTALKRLEKTVDAAHNLTKEKTDTTAASLTSEKGWSE